MPRAPRFTAIVLALLVGGCAPVLIVHQPIDAKLYPEPARNTITFWGHATVYMDVEGTGIVTDPVLGERYSIFHGRTVPRPPPEAFDQTSIIEHAVRHAPPMAPQPAPSPAARSGWPGGRWYWEGIRARAAQR